MNYLNNNNNEKNYYYDNIYVKGSFYFIRYIKDFTKLTLVKIILINFVKIITTTKI